MIQNRLLKLVKVGFFSEEKKRMFYLERPKEPGVMIYIIKKSQERLYGKQMQIS
jgi:hypothetical protein